jgi:hypothetical protein
VVHVPWRAYREAMKMLVAAWSTSALTGATEPGHQ